MMRTSTTTTTTMNRVLLVHPAESPIRPLAAVADWPPEPQAASRLLRYQPRVAASPLDPILFAGAQSFLSRRGPHRLFSSPLSSYPRPWLRRLRPRYPPEEGGRDRSPPAGRHHPPPPPPPRARRQRPVDARAARWKRRPPRGRSAAAPVHVASAPTAREGAAPDDPRRARSDPAPAVPAPAAVPAAPAAAASRSATSRRLF